MTTIGYGDLTPKNPYETLFIIVIMMFTAICFTFILGLM